MKNFISKICLASVFFLILAACSTEETTSDKGLVLNDDLQTSSKTQVLTCHTFTVYFFGFGETDLHYCCVGDSLCAPSPPVVGCYCGFISDTNYDNLGKGSTQLNQIHISELLPGVSPTPKTITLNSSTKAEINGKIYEVKKWEYSVDEKGFVIFELVEV